MAANITKGEHKCLQQEYIAPPKKYSFQKENLSRTRTAFRGNYHFTENAEVRDSNTTIECNQKSQTPEELTL